MTLLPSPHDERGIELQLVPIDELPRWKPPGTVEVTVLVETMDAERAVAALQRHDLRSEVHPSQTASKKHHVTILRHYGTRSPTGDQQRELMGSIGAVLKESGIRYQLVSHGVVVGGGTPSHRWIKVEPVGVRVLAADAAELEHQVRLVAEALGIPSKELWTEAPADWPSQ